MTRFGRWFAGALLLVVALFVIGLLMPGSRSILRPAREAAPAPAAAPRSTVETTPSGLTIPVANVRAADLPCRYGGEEFVVAMPGTDLAAAERIAERIRMHVAGSPLRLDRPFRPTHMSPPSRF